MNTEIYTGPSGGLKKDSPWLASEDVGDAELRVMIEDVSVHKNVAFDKGRVEPKVGALKLSGMVKRMVLNSTNRKRLVKMFGMDTKFWRGKWVTLWVDTNVKMAGEIVNGLRIKEAEQGAPPVDLGELPEAWAGWSNEERGDYMATQGLEKLQAWWASLPKGPEKTALAARLRNDWKPDAEKANPTT